MKNKTILIPNSFYGRTVPAIFHQRLHRFAAQVETEEGVEEVHIPNSGRLAELLFAGNQVGLHFEGRKGRKTRYTLVKAQTDDGWAFIDSRLPNRILAKHWQDLPPLHVYDKAYPETTVGASRFAVVLQESKQEKKACLEAKCVTLVQEGAGLFPDAPTERGTELPVVRARLSRVRHRGLLFYVVLPPG